jgi:hypothetical protein
VIRLGSWNPEVFAEGHWTGNGLRFATEAEAARWGRMLLLRWYVPTDSRAAACDEEPTHVLTADGDTVHERTSTLYEVCGFLFDDLSEALEVLTEARSSDGAAS